MAKKDPKITKYPNYLLTDWWFFLKWRLIFGNKRSRCYICGETSTLLLHHVSYANFYKEKLERDVYILCSDCHNQAHFWTIFKIKVPLTTNWLLFSMRLRKAIFYTQKHKFGLSLLWFLIISIILFFNTLKFILKIIGQMTSKLIWIILKRFLLNIGIKVTS